MVRLHHRIPVLAAVVTVAAATAPAAYALDASAPSGAPTPTGAQHHVPGSTDWALIGLGTAGAITLAGAGVAGSRRGRRHTRPATHVGAASRS
jgi:hypothetical protein